MSSLKVEIVAIDAIQPHPNADRLELAQIAGWQCVVRKGEFKAGDAVVYIPIDSVLPVELESKLFPPESKVKLSRSRIKTIKLRGAISQGLIISIREIVSFGYKLPSHALGTDLAETLGITKFEPPTKPVSARGAQQVSKKKINPHFSKYTDIENFKHYNRLFEEGELVYVTEKLHGTSARYGWLPTEVNTIWKRIKKFFGLLAPFEFCLGSRNVQLQDKTYTGFYAENVYGKIAEQESLKNKLTNGEVVYGEIVGAGIQANYTYGCGHGEHKFFAYDVMVNGTYLNPQEFLEFCYVRNIPSVPVLYMGEYHQEEIDNLRSGDSFIGDQKVREGIVIKPMIESTCLIGRKVLKYLNDEYLLGDQTDFH